MLDRSETIRRIDTARDILVGKVPDPKSQVEQITIALIYKFMDDMDRTSVDMGGKASFFTGEYKRYGWSKIFAPRLGGHEMLNLYAEAIEKLNQNRNIPQLFRDIFKNAYLPYRDPETLKLFLRTINEFTYDHSENLGDAFEYLLSILGSQGDAGQFRTPRHIIDFMVEVINPQKNETIIDPACGTAGFLISSYKHIMKANTEKKPGDRLGVKERKNLLENFTGYDISPDMVRLSLVNLYLHGFSQPKIFEYDTLTSDERWNSYADVILANPPFMSPKGGIKPHKRFSVQSNRSEVLFVDYIAEHLTASGRSAVIVPEGIIFQSGKAYKQLRKMLVDKYLYAVVSLPAGVFNPYSGVKTSILFFEPLLAQKSDSVLFVKVENDGLSLGAQRRTIDKNDLPDAMKLIEEFRKGISDGKKGQSIKFSSSAVSHLVVSKEKIASNGEYNLSGERYKEVINTTSNYPLIPLSELAHIKNGYAFKSDEYVDSGLRVIRIKNVQKGIIVDDDPKFMALDRQNEFCNFLLRKDDILMSLTGNVGRVGRLKQEHEPAVLNQRVAHIQLFEDAPCLSEYLYALLNTDVFEANAIAGAGGVAQANLSSKWVADYKIPLPPLEIQKEVVAEIEGYQKVIDGARQVVENWKPHIAVDPEWPMVKLGEVCETIMDGTHFSPINSDSGEYLYITSKNIRENHLDLSSVSYVSEKDHRAIYSRCPVKFGDVLYIKDGSNTGLATINILEEEFSLLSSVAVIRGKLEYLDNPYLAFYLNSKEGRKNLLSMISGVAITRLTLAKLNYAQIPLPPISIQHAIVEEMEAEQALVSANRKLIARMEKKIQAVLARVWGVASTRGDK